MQINERNFEETIELALLANGPHSPATGGAVAETRPGYNAQPGEAAARELYGESGGYYKRTAADYDKELCVIRRDVVDFLLATQPKEYAKLVQQYGADAEIKLFQRLASELKNRSTLDILRNGLKANGCRFKLAYFRPNSSLNPEQQQLYAGNIFSVARQLKYSLRNENSLDIGIFLNGLPIFTAELKNHFTGQTVQHAMHQYRTDRDIAEPLFGFGRCLAHFAVDNDEVYMTSHLQGAKTRFLPFNKGRNGGKGNPPSLTSFASAYLWEQVWARDSVLNLIQHFIHQYEEEDAEGRKTGQRRLIFPRYHQLEAVRRLLGDARTHGAGRRYLIQHSAGSGKSNSIAWLAHQLSVLQSAENRRIFDSVIVITDRRVLDRQLQRTVRQFEQTLGVVENIDTTSRQLKDALEDGKNIIVTTLQKFPVIVSQVSALPGKQFALIIDEAHSSQSGESTKSLKQVLAVASLEADTGEAEEETDPANELEDKIVEEIRKRGQLPNISTFAFTATPKPKTLELFGTKQADGKFGPFSLYSMRQAIEEGFILDVLENYTTYGTYWNLRKRIETDPHYDKSKAISLLKNFVETDPKTIARKVDVMLEHFVENVQHRIGNKAKAMIVTRSRLQAVRYKLAVDDYLREKGLNFKALVAFSGTVKAKGLDYTEPTMNHLPETQTAKTFERDEYKILIVANKFQTGFDQPLLHTMYVDKKLGGVNAVQTLSRLNRVHPGKEETFVLDFANSAEEIQKAFEPYYEKTLLSAATDPNLLYDYQTRLASFDIFSTSEVQAFAALYFNPTITQDRLHAALAPIVERYEEKPEPEQADFRSQLTDYNRLYAFLSQIIPFADSELEMLYQFSRFLLRKLPIKREALPLEVQQNVDIDSYRIQQISRGKIKLTRGQQEVDPIAAKENKTGLYLAEIDIEPLSQIVTDLNKRFGTDFNDEDKFSLRTLEERLDENTALKASLKINSAENTRLTFIQVVRSQLMEMAESHFKFYKQVNDDADFADFFLDQLFQRFVERTKAA